MKFGAARDRPRPRCATGRTRSSASSPAGSAGWRKQRKVEVVTRRRRSSPPTTRVERRRHVDRVRALHPRAPARARRCCRASPTTSAIVDSTGALELARRPRAAARDRRRDHRPRDGDRLRGARAARSTVVELTDQLIPGCDPDLVKPLQKRIAERYESILLSTERRRASRPPTTGCEVSFEGEDAPEPRTFDRVLVAVGRQANGDRLGARRRRASRSTSAAQIARRRAAAHERRRTSRDRRPHRGADARAQGDATRARSRPR